MAGCSLYFEVFHEAHVQGGRREVHYELGVLDVTASVMLQSRLGEGSAHVGLEASFSIQPFASLIPWS